MHDVTISILSAEELDGHAGPLAAIIAATVNGGAAVGFMQPFDFADAMTFLDTKVFPEVRAGRRLLFAAWLDGQAVGTVQLDICLPANQPHRCEVAKMMVHPDARRKGVGMALMRALEREARARGKSLITLDTRTGDVAGPLYRAAGFVEAGVIPGYALDPDGQRLHATTYMYKAL